MITVKRLIEKLKIRPQNMQVVVPDDSGEFDFKPLIEDEIGVKEVTWGEGTEDGPEAKEKCLVLGVDTNVHSDEPWTAPQDFPLPSMEENPDGLHQRYHVIKANGQPTDPQAEYFVLRLDDGGKDPNHVAACRKAVLAYAKAIKKYIPKLASDLEERYK